MRSASGLFLLVTSYGNRPDLTLLDAAFMAAFFISVETNRPPPKLLPIIPDFITVIFNAFNAVSWATANPLYGEQSANTCTK